MSKLLIAFGHKRLRGKDTAGKLAQSYLESLGHAVRMDSFAAPLKRACMVIFGFTEAQVNGNLKEVVDTYWGFTPRWALQTVGTNAMREQVQDDVWVKSLEQRLIVNPEHVLITDLRFPNEAEGVRKMGGVLVKVERQYPADSSIDEHISETALNPWTDWDYTIINNGTLANLEEQTRSIVLNELQKRNLHTERHD